MKNLKSRPGHPGIWFVILLAMVLALLFWRSFLPGYVHFSNDNPLGQYATDWSQLPGAFTGAWDDLNSTGFNAGAWPIEISQCIRWLIGSLAFAKFLPAIALFIMGLGAWSFFRGLKLSAFAAGLGAVAMVLCSTCFAGACWGVASQEVAFGMVFFAFALVLANDAATPPLIRWARLALAGLCVGMNVMEAADIGALGSIVAALFIFYKSLIEDESGVWMKTLRGVGRVAVVAIFAGLLAAQTIVSLVSTQIQGVGDMTQDAKSEVKHWDWATQWSLPKTETLGLIVPGLFGYKMDTPKDMMPQVAEFYENGEYWGGMGRDPALDRWFDSGSQGAPPSGFMRFTGGGNYLGILVVLFAVWAVALVWRRERSPYSLMQRKMIFFWLGVGGVSLLLAWGRFAPFYALLYHLPYFSTIRNPAKFLIFVSWAAVILFAYGVHALSLRGAKDVPSKPGGPLAHLMNWWARASQFERRWTYGCGAFFAASVVGWLIFSSEKNVFIQYLQLRGFQDQATAQGIAEFAIAQAGWFVPLLAVAILLLLLAVSGFFTGSRARWGTALITAFVLFDLGRADLPYVAHWNYKQKYEVGDLNPVVKFLAEQPYEHRVAGLPFNAPQGLGLLDQLYRIEWMQQLFPYYNVQCLDIIQMPRMAEDLKNYLTALSPNGTEASVPLIARHWELTNTRYLLGPAGFLAVMNQQLDPEKHRFRIAQQFEIVPKPGIVKPTQLEDLTAVLDPKGNYALFEFTGALPRAKLYGNWQVNTNDPAVLNQLADLKFDPHQTVLVDTPEKNLPDISTNANTGTVTYTNYAPKTIVLEAQAVTPSVLLLNDKYDADWHVTVDGRPAPLLRCNYLMRGVYLTAGAHTVEFHFVLSNKPLYITLSALGVGVILCVLLLVACRWKKQPSVSQ